MIEARFNRILNALDKKIDTNEVATGYTTLEQAMPDICEAVKDMTNEQWQKVLKARNEH